jgi:hypothetical protein
VNRVAAAVVLVPLGCALSLAASGAASRGPYSCDREQLAFALPQVSPPMQTWAVGFAVHNTGPRCRLALPVSLTLAHRSGRPLRVVPRRSRLTLVARSFGPRARAGVTWTYWNYCGPDRSIERAVTHVVRVAGIQLRGAGGTPPCHAPAQPVRLSVLFACPGATGPAIRAVLPRPSQLCPR